MTVLFQEVSKRFILRHERARSFQEAFINIWNRRNRSREEFWALRDVSFELEEGGTLGIIGENGSGKSTALKLITRIIEPTRGAIKVQGKVAALLELGAGFHHDLTGRENIFLNGSILGMTGKEMRARFPGIVEFSELERFIDTPIKHYSSGMYARLGFAVAISVDPDILVIDEVLAVGDEAFQRKCLDKIREIKDAGKSIILVSHNLQMVRDLCAQAVWLDGGLERARGPSHEVVDQYLEWANRKDKARLEGTHAKAPEESPEEEAHRWGTKEVEITKVLKNVLTDHLYPSLGGLVATPAIPVHAYSLQPHLGQHLHEIALATAQVYDPVASLEEGQVEGVDAALFLPGDPDVPKEVEVQVFHGPLGRRW